MNADVFQKRFSINPASAAQTEETFRKAEQHLPVFSHRFEALFRTCLHEIYHHIGVFAYDAHDPQIQCTL